MATATQHARQASDNQTFLDTIDANQFPDWAVTVAFYKAVHVVEGLLVRKGRPSGNHTSRNNTLKGHFVAVWWQYRPLYALSRVSRYDCVPIRPAQVVSARQRLSNVEAAVAAVP